LGHDVWRRDETRLVHDLAEQSVWVTQRLDAD
jgi:hypothetical protein